VNLGKRVLYRRQDIADWVASCVVATGNTAPLGFVDVEKDGEVISFAQLVAGCIESGPTLLRGGTKDARTLEVIGLMTPRIFWLF
jgi:hypothetical protein